MRKFGIFGNLDAPTLVVGQVPVQTVHLVERHDVENALHLVLVEEVTSNVEHISTIRQQWFVFDVKHRNVPLSLRSRLGIESLGHELTQGLQSIEEASTMRSFDFDVLFGDFERIGFCAHDALVGNQRNHAVSYRGR